MLAQLKEKLPNAQCCLKMEMLAGKEWIMVSSGVEAQGRQSFGADSVVETEESEHRSNLH